MVVWPLFPLFPAKAGIKDVPINVHSVTKEQADQLMRDKNRGRTTVLRFLELSRIALLKYALFFVIIRFCWPGDVRLSCKLLFIWRFIWFAVLELCCRIFRCTLFSGEATDLRVFIQWKIGGRPRLVHQCILVVWPLFLFYFYDPYFYNGESSYCTG